MPRWPSRGGRRGQSAVELAIALPLLLLLISGAVDFGMAYETVQRLDGAARVAAAAAAAAMDNQPLSGGVSAQAQAAALAAARQALPDLAGALQVQVAWDGDPVTTSSPDPGAALAAQIPQYATTTQTLDFQHEHDNISYPQPVFGSANWGQWQQPWWSYIDTVNSTFTGSSTRWSVYPYWDLTNAPGYVYPTSWFQVTNAVPLIWAFGGGWWGSWVGDYVSWIDWFWLPRWTAWTPGTGWYTQAAWPGTAWRGVPTNPFFTSDQVQYQSGWQTATTTSDTAGPVVQVGPYSQSAGSQQQSFASAAGTDTLASRLIRVTVAVPARPLTPIMAPFLGGRLLAGAGDAAAVSAQP